MSINISQAFKRTSANPVDESLTLTKAQMKTVNDNLMPSKYFTVGQEDGYIYLYDKSNTVDPATGKYRKFEGGGGGGASSMSDLDDVLLTTLEEGQTLIWDDTEEKWVNGTVTAVTELENLTDVNITDPANGQVLKYDDTSGKWINGSGGGGSSYTAGDGIDITNDVISTKQSQEGDIDEIIDVYPQAGNLVSIVNAFNRGDIYSTDEKMIGQWHDGKPLYQQVVTGAISQTGWNTFNHNIANIDTVVKIEVFLTALNSQSIPYVYSLGRTVANDGMMASFSPSTWGVNVSNGFASGTATAILQYTKTTDTAISIGTETEYSTDEKVVGTWIDGKPIWQKTIDCGLLPNATSKSIAHGISNFYMPVHVFGVAHRTNGASILLPCVRAKYTGTTTDVAMSQFVSIDIDATNIVIATGFDWSAITDKSYVTLQYIKTT